MDVLLREIDTLLDRVFCAPAVSIACTFDEARRPLAAAEQAMIPTAGEKRTAEFRAGRHCAHAALEELDADVAALLADDRGAPRWPTGVVGSIAHTGKISDGWAVAVAGRAFDYASVGVDLEQADAVREGLVERILRPSELALLDTRELSATQWAKIAFSCKEATYKCQYPLTRCFLEFHDLELRVAMAPKIAGSTRGGTFQSIFRKAAPPFRVGDALFGTFAMTDTLLLSGVTLPAEGSPSEEPEGYDL